MTMRSSKYLPIFLWLMFIIGAAISLVIMFNAGCAGDPKGGTLGDPIRALELEGMSLLLLLLSVVSCGAAIIYGSKSVHRVAHGLAFATFMFFCLWLSGIEIELWGLQSCYKSVSMIYRKSSTTIFVLFNPRMVLPSVLS